LLIECGTNRGGSALFYSHLLDLLDYGNLISIDIEKMHSIQHPRATFLIGDSLSSDIRQQVEKTVSDVSGPVMVILDSDHSESHVYRELETYAPFVTPNSFCLVQDGVIDTLYMFRKGRPGPLGAIKRFLQKHDEFLLDRVRERRFLITSHPMGWLKRRAD